MTARDDPPDARRPTGEGVRVPYAITAPDLDEHGHLDLERCHEMLEEARRRVLVDPIDEPVAHHAFVVARIELDHRREVLPEHGPVEARAWISRIGTRSITIDNALVRADGVVAAEGPTVMVAWDMVARGSRPVTGAERAAYAATRA